MIGPCKGEDGQTIIGQCVVLVEGAAPLFLNETVGEMILRVEEAK